VTRPDEFKNNADDCRKQAERATNDIDKEYWLRLAEHWLKMAQLAEQGLPGGDPTGGIA
jgi:hypothetical protein